MLSGNVVIACSTLAEAVLVLLTGRPTVYRSPEPVTEKSREKSGARNGAPQSEPRRGLAAALLGIDGNGGGAHLSGLGDASAHETA